MSTVDISKIGNIDSFTENGIDNVGDKSIETAYIDPVKQISYGISVNLLALKARKEKKIGKDISWQKVSEDTGLAYTTVLRWAKNQVDRYDSDTMVILCKYFDADLSELLISEEIIG